MTQLIQQLKDEQQDFEFYPTTKEIIGSLINSLKGERFTSSDESILDIGAGNGKVLQAVRDAEIGMRDLYAIEKSELLRNRLDAEIMVIGTDFHEQSLLSKNSTVTFCNPPYTEFEAWAVKIIRQSGSRLVYLVIPQRWERSQPIADALKFRDAKHHVIGSFDFEDAEDRAARAKVHLIRIEFRRDKDDAFDRFFDEQFAPLIDNFNPKAEEDSSKSKESKGKFGDLVVGPSYPEALVSLYNAEMAKIQKNYELVCQLDPDLLKEFDVTVEKVRKCLKERLVGMRNVYWNELFSRMSAITSRLTSKSRRALLGTLGKQNHIDFTVSNIHAVIVWVIKNANKYLDGQLCETYGKMIEMANVKLYKSNQKPFSFDRWRYSEENNSTHFMLEYRIVMHSCGGLKSGEYAFEQGIEDSAAEFLEDMLTIANNLGFECNNDDNRLWHQSRRQWTNVAQEFGYKAEMEIGDKVKGFGAIKDKVKLDGGAWQYQIGAEWYHEKCLPGAVLFEARAFKNRNMHIRMNPKFAMALNVEYGRLMGWIHSGEEAAEEMQEPEVAKYFKANHQLLGNSPLLALT
jgi:hypothetical protein